MRFIIHRGAVAKGGREGVCVCGRGQDGTATNKSNPAQISARTWLHEFVLLSREIIARRIPAEGAGGGRAPGRERRALPRGYNGGMKRLGLLV